MIRRLLPVLFLILAAFIHVITLGKAADAMKTLPAAENQSVVIPAPILKIASLEFRGLASDIFFIKSMIFIGGAQQRQETPRVKEWEWKWWTSTLDTSTDLDPYFFDPYFYANAFLPWDAHRAKDANRLLEKGSRYRTWDWMLPFFIGFNDFFFLHNDEEAAAYLMEASHRPGGDPKFGSIASRLAFKENRTETAIYFLEETAKNTEDRALRASYEKRITALQSIVFLDKAVTQFRKKFKRVPSSLDELVATHIIRQLPQDPYGGTYYIVQDGTVRSTTSSELEPYLSPIHKKILEEEHDTSHHHE